jgi:peptidoglycan/xylan/chitin deacetylase (PgdA/CDA1 family)
MVQPLRIVMYHYVRDLVRTRYPGINGLDVAAFHRQLDHLQSSSTIVRMEDVHEAVRGRAELPPDATLLTFDDGYADHYTVVFPILHERGLQGSFFAPVAPVRDGVLLDVNRVHFVLASVASPAELAAAIDEDVNAHRERDDVGPVSAYRTEWAQPNRFDDGETVYVKRMLQTALPEDLRAEIAARLFRRFVGIDESTFAAELYLSREQAKVMVANGMHFGSHGASHVWLNRASRESQIAEIEQSCSFLDDLGMPVQDGWTMCYPYGGWNPELVELLRERRCTVGLTTEVATAMVGGHDPLLLPRYDTNDFPQ